MKCAIQPVTVREIAPRIETNGWLGLSRSPLPLPLLSESLEVASPPSSRGTLVILGLQQGATGALYGALSILASSLDCEGQHCLFAASHFEITETNSFFCFCKRF